MNVDIKFEEPEQEERDSSGKSPHDNEAVPSAPKTRKRNPKYLFLALVVALLAGAVFQLSRIENAKSKPETLAATDQQTEQEQILEKISQVILLPDEKPTMFTLSDVSKLSQASAIFNKAENGDKLLVFSEAKRAVLFRPSISKVIDITNVSSGSNAESETSSEKIPKQQ